MNEVRMKMVGRGECKCFATRGQWFQEKELKEEVIERRSKNEGCCALKRLGMQSLFISEKKWFLPVP